MEDIVAQPATAGIVQKCVRNLSLRYPVPPPAMLIFAGGAVSAVFYYVMLAAYLAFLPWPEDERALWYSAAVLAFALVIVAPGGLAPWHLYWAALLVPLVAAWPRLHARTGGSVV